MTDVQPRRLRATSPPKFLPAPASPLSGDQCQITVDLTSPIAEEDIFSGPRAVAWERNVARALLTLDALLVSAATVVVYHQRFLVGQQHYDDRALSLVLVPLWLLLLWMGHAYQVWQIPSTATQARCILVSSGRTAVVAGVLSYGLMLHLSRLFLLLSLAAGTAALLTGRWGAGAVLGRLRVSGRCQYSVLAVGFPEDVAHLVQQASRDHIQGLVVSGACIPGTLEWLALEGQPALPVLGDPRLAGVIARASGADVLAVASDSVLDRRDLRRLSWELEGTRVRLLLAPRLTDVAGPRISIRPLAGLPLLHVDEPRFSGPARLLKGGIDRLGAAIGILLLAPMFLLLALAIRLDSTGPAFFRQRRVGLAGVPFTCWKLRTMYSGAERDVALLLARNDSDGLLFKVHEDPRVTRLGRLLRRCSLDELPQLLNVVAGNMSLVGPRPPLPDEVDRYEQDVRRRLLVKPGLTGLWQVNGRSDLPWDEAVRLDLFYVENWSPALDFMILVRTVKAVCSQRGAY